LFLLEDLLGLHSWDLVVHFIAPAAMAKINEQFLDHEGSTDVITFDLREGYGEPEFARQELAGEIYISIADAVKQAGQFSTEWPEEVARYVVHGVLHLRGYGDLEPAARTAMKREENRLLKALGRRFSLRAIAA
jgi:probable rRNA maturation factor